MISRLGLRIGRAIAAATAALLLALLMLVAANSTSYAYDADGNPVVVSIGDSYSSGEGIEPFYS